ncbi:LuxR family transcriptional regulator [Novosphingobium sp. BW1]|uniref:LuxR family transcriptional regulator n=1 Tax=Novosphingobium sp. BW1 TaxID=2592621 RepID=UPI0011DE77DC|nr:LuxR family transcriptional regulator [Novosphingobium sp. BW1]TYC79390.1 LuxR family transcriptional regulator [Novosphingobium sp. BW1]
MRLVLAEDLVSLVSSANSEADLFTALAEVTNRLGFDHFALSYDRRPGSRDSTAMLVHDYPDAWAKVYVGFDLGGNDPVRRACAKAMTGFEWRHLDRFISLTKGDRRMLMVGRESGIGDGYTVPRHLPGEASGSCSFVVRPNGSLPRSMLHVAEIVGAFALASARRTAGAIAPRTKPVLSERQRECVLWSARGKTAAEIAIILGIKEGTVIQHLKTARERYDVHSRQSLVLCVLFDGLISFADVFRWWTMT